MVIWKPHIWEEYNNPDTLDPWKFNEDIIYLTNNNPQDDDLVLMTIYKTSPNEYDDDEEPWGENNSDA